MRSDCGSRRWASPGRRYPSPLRPRKVSKVTRPKDPTRPRSPWAVSMLADMLHNPTYKGSDDMDSRYGVVELPSRGAGRCRHMGLRAGRHGSEQADVEAECQAGLPATRPAEVWALRVLVQRVHEDGVGVYRWTGNGSGSPRCIAGLVNGQALETAIWRRSGRSSTSPTSTSLRRRRNFVSGWPTLAGTTKSGEVAGELP